MDYHGAKIFYGSKCGDGSLYRCLFQPTGRLARQKRNCVLYYSADLQVGPINHLVCFTAYVIADVLCGSSVFSSLRMKLCAAKQGLGYVVVYYMYKMIPPKY